MAAPTEDLTPWLNRVRKATTRAEIYAILDQFRTLEWSDEQRSLMSKQYVRIVERLSDSSQDQAKPAAPQAEEDNGPVWYEKM